MLSTLNRSIRVLRRSPAFAAVATLSLAVGIGLSTATFAIVDSMLKPKIAIADVDRLFRESLRLGNQKHPPSIVEQVRALESLPGIEAVAVTTGAMRAGVETNGVVSWMVVATTTPNFFSTIGVTLSIGRLPSREEIQAKTAVVLTTSSWHRLFPKRSSIDGASIRVGDHDYAVVGVLAPGFEALMGGEIWLPAASAVELQDLRYPTIIAKLKVGVDSITIKPQLATVAANFTAAYVQPGAPPYEIQSRGMRPKPPSLRDNELPLLMAGIAIGVLAIACINVSALSLARGLTKRRDYALRVALGASRIDIASEVLAEMLLLALIGAACGFMLAIALVGTLRHMVPEDLMQRGYFIPELNARVFGLTLLTLLLGILVAGAIPAWRASRTNPADPLKDNAGTTTGRSRNEFKMLVMGELAIAMALLMLSSLFTLSTRNLTKYDFGFDARRVLVANVNLPRSRDSLALASKVAILEASVQRVAAMPGIAKVSTQGYGRFEGDHITSDVGREAEPLFHRSGFVQAGPEFFATLGARLVEGRDFAEGDRSRGAVILSQHAAKLLFPHGGALGRTVKLGDERSTRAWLPVIGIAPDVRLGFYGDGYAEQDTAVYASTSDRSIDNSWLVIRSDREDPALKLSVLRTLRDALPPGSATGVSSFVDDLDLRVRIQGLFDRIFSFLSAASLLLGAAGLFSVMSYTVSQRLREFAVRQALGAARRDILRLVLRGAFELALGGTAFGALLSFWASAGVSTLLFGVKNTDPVALVVAEATLLAVTMIASLVPAYRAMKVDPVEVLRAT